MEEEYIDLLFQYEETGLTPEEITELLVAHRTEYCEAADYDCAKLGEYRKAETEGRLVVLPCKVGDTVYVAREEFGIRVEKVRTFFIGHPSYKIERRNMRMIRTETCDIPLEEFGKSVFLSRAEAEAALNAPPQPEN